MNRYYSRKFDKIFEPNHVMTVERTARRRDNTFADSDLYPRLGQMKSPRQLITNGGIRILRLVVRCYTCKYAKIQIQNFSLPSAHVAW